MRTWSWLTLVAFLATLTLSSAGQAKSEHLMPGIRSTHVNVHGTCAIACHAATSNHGLSVHRSSSRSA